MKKTTSKSTDSNGSTGFFVFIIIAIGIAIGIVRIPMTPRSQETYMMQRVSSFQVDSLFEKVGSKSLIIGYADTTNPTEDMFTSEVDYRKLYQLDNFYRASGQKNFRDDAGIFIDNKKMFIRVYLQGGELLERGVYFSPVYHNGKWHSAFTYWNCIYKEGVPLTQTNHERLIKFEE